MSIFSFLRRKPKQTKLIPESLFVVGFDTERVWCSYPANGEQSLQWSELIRVAVQTTDEGPLSPDVFFILGAKEGTLIFPQGAIGEAEMLHQLQKLPGFNNEALIEAMGCTDNKTFICWEKRPEHEREPNA